MLQIYREKETYIKPETIRGSNCSAQEKNRIPTFSRQNAFLLLITIWFQLLWMETGCVKFPWICYPIFIFVWISWNSYFSYVRTVRIWISSKLILCAFTRKDATEIDDYFNEDFITQHDVLRDLAIHLSNQEPVLQRKRLIVDINGNNPPKWWTEQKQQLINARLLSISTGWLIFSLTEIHTHTCTHAM